MKKGLVALSLVFLFCFSLIHVPTELEEKLVFQTDSDGDGLEDLVDPCPDSQGTWQTMVVDSTDGSGDGGLDIVVDSNNNPRIAYYDSTNANLRYANWSQGQWFISTIDSSDAGMGVDIELDQNETSVFAYMSGNFVKLYNEETGFHSKTVKGYASVYGRIEFEIDSQDRAFASYRTTSAIDSSVSVDGQYFISFDTTGDDRLIQETNSQYHTLTLLPSGELVAIVNGKLYTDVMDEHQNMGNRGAIADQWMPSTRADSNGYLHHVASVSSNPRDIVYRVIDPSNAGSPLISQDESVDTDNDIIRERTNLALDSDEQPHIVYSRFNDPGFTYAKLIDGTWEFSTIDSQSGTIRNPVIEIDSNNQPHIAYHRDNSGALVYMTKTMTDSDGDGCLDSEDAFPNDAYEQFDDDGNGVGDNEDYSGRIYNISPVNGTSAGGTEVTITGSNFDSLISQNLEEKIWSISTVENSVSTAGQISLTIDKPEDKLYAMYTTTSGLDLVSKYKYAEPWQNLKSFSTGYWPTLSMNQDTNHVMIAYFETANKDLKGAHWNPSSQNGGDGIIDGNFGLDVGNMASNAICTLSMVNCGATSATDFRQISYYDQTNGDLKRAWYNGNWNTQTIDSTDDVGHYTSIVLDSKGSIHISYCDYTNSAIKYATSESGNQGTWQISTVLHLENGNGCTPSSIAVDSNDNIYIATNSNGNNYSKIKLAVNKGGIWDIDTVNTNQNWAPSLILDSNDRIFISYFEYSEQAQNWNLVVSSSDGSNWNTEIVDSEFDNIGHIDSALDSNEDLHLLYSVIDSNQGIIKHAHNRKIESIPMLGHWKMDGYDSENHVEDSSGNDWDALQNGGPLFDQQGIHNDSIYFDGVDDYVYIPGADFSGLNQMSISAWINPSSLHTQSSANKMIMSQDSVWYFYLKKNSTNTQLVWEISGNYAVQSTTTFAKDTWYHVAAKWDGSYACVYINAVEEGCRAYPDVSSAMPSSTNNPQIGAQAGNHNWFHGYIDELRLYGTSLHSSEIESLYEMNSNDSENSSVVLPLQARFSTSEWTETVNLTYVDNNTLTLTTPPGPEEQTVNLTLIGTNGQELVLQDAYTFDTTAVDSDGDGYLDNTDDCPSSFGNSTNDRIGCIDSDGDGYSDADETWSVEMGADAFNQDSSQWSDTDGDGFGDNVGGNEYDLCHDVPGNSTLDRFGCPDTDGDGYSDPDSFWSASLWDSIGIGPDEFYLDPTQWRDIDGDGYGDNSSENATTPDDCPDIWGNSTFDRYGCLDSDGDGMSDEIDDFPQDAQRTSDVDDDGLDDLYDDNCPNTYNPLQEDLDGDGLGDLCDTDEDGDGIHDGIDNCPQGAIGWTSGTLLDYDGDGCLDGAEDTDDDGDGVMDGMDGCPKGDFGWQSSNITDHDSDGCNDNSEDLDDDGDGKDDSKDSCPKGANDWTSTTITDRDDDGCRDYDEDIDDDGDGVDDENDSCPTGVTQWVSNPSTDSNSDGCHDDLDESPNQTNEEKSESFVDLLASGNLDAIGIVLAILLPVVGISVSLMLRKRKASFVQTLGDRIDDCKSGSDLDSINNELMDLVAKDNINQAQYDVLKFKIEGKRSALHSEVFQASTTQINSQISENIPDSSITGYDGNDGYEWLDFDGNKWYRLSNSGSQWNKWNN